MEDTYRKLKFTHLFKILDFDHDGLLQEADFMSLGENIAIFRCLEPPSDVEDLITRRGQEFWKSLKNFTNLQPMTRCNLQNWLKYLDEITSVDSPQDFHQQARDAVDDIFFIYDKNHDDFISKQEYLCLFVSLRVEIKQADECFRLLDLNDDQKISREEMFLAIMQFFLSEDKDQPGNLLFGNPESFQFETRGSMFSGMRRI